jgi:hypothetical protein
MALTEQEKVSIRHHLGYLNVSAAATFVLGSPSAVEPQFIIESAMDKVLEAALPLVRRIVGILDGLEAQKVEDYENLAVSELGSIKLRPDEQAMLDEQLDYWRGALVNALGITTNPFDKRGGGINVPVG